KLAYSAAVSELAALIARAITDDPPLSVRDGGLIRAGFSVELDALRGASGEGRAWIAKLEMDERARTGINSLKVGYNRVFGYFIEITRSHVHLVPADYQRRQTLTGAERYVTPALKEFEEKVLTAAERIEDRERELFEALRRRIGGEIVRLQCI